MAQVMGIWFEEERVVAGIAFGGIGGLAYERTDEFIVKHLRERADGMEAWGKTHYPERVAELRAAADEIEATA